jgi:hypothetical protein
MKRSLRCQCTSLSGKTIGSDDVLEFKRIEGAMTQTKKFLRRYSNPVKLTSTTTQDSKMLAELPRNITRSVGG